jgi:hypothetical protein
MAAARYSTTPATSQNPSPNPPGLSVAMKKSPVVARFESPLVAGL